MSVAVAYKITGRGWADCTIDIDGQRIRLEASFLSDSLDDLLRATRVAVEARMESTAIFTDEPGESRLKLIPSGDRLLVRALRFRDEFSKASDDEGELVAEAECRLRTFAGAVLAACQEVYREVGVEAYQASMRHTFPIEQMDALRAALQTKHSN